MSKRTAEEFEDGNQAYLKRQRISGVEQPPPSNAADQIRSPRQLRQLLTFEQDAGRSKQAIQSFKVFLDAFANKEEDNSNRISVLKEFLESQKPADDEDKTAIYLEDLIKTWSFAATSNDDSLLSAVPAVLGLLMKTMSSILELSEYGLRLGRTVLQKTQQELLARGLTAKKDWVSSPSLRLLRELISFDGGALANQVFRARDQTFRGLAKSLRQKREGDDVEDRRRPSVRTNAVRVMLAAIKLLSAKEKRDLLNSRELVAAFTKNIYQDPPFIIREILETLRTSVLQNDEVPRDAKTKIVNANSLKQIATLYRYHQPDEEASAGRKKAVDAAAHEFLLLACTSPDLGVLNRQAGFYPRGVDPDDIQDVGASQNSIDLGLDSIEWMDQFTKEIPVRNTILSEFIQNLTPWSNTKQSDLLLTILKHAPELFADYFMGKKDFSFEPKLTATWIGYAAFLFSSLQLPVPKYFGNHQKYARLPPPTSIVLENILPQALSQKALSHCLNQPHSLITFFAVRLLYVALNKFRDVMSMYQEAGSGSSSIWLEAAERLSVDFCQKCPSIKDLISAFRKIPNTDLMQREAVTKLLVLYFEVVPRIALGAKYDVSAMLAEVLTLDEPTLSPEDRVLHALEVENLFQFAHFSPGMRWFAKAGGLTISPFMAMLKLSAEAPANFPLLKLRTVLDSVVKESKILQTQTSISAPENLVLRLREVRGPKSGAVWEFLDDCISRCASNSVKYIFALEEFQVEAHGSDEKQRPLSLLTLAIVEQWPFIAKSADPEEFKEIADFVAAYLATSSSIKEDKKVLKLITRKLVSITEAPIIRNIIEDSSKLVGTIAIPKDPSLSSPYDNVVEPTTTDPGNSTGMDISLESPEVPVDHNELVKWNSKEVDEVIEGGHAAALIKLLSSDIYSVRKEAATSLTKFSAKLKESTFEEKDQIWLLLLEVVETAKKCPSTVPLPSIISSFAASSVTVLNDPLHCLYEKINKFLSQGPTWELDKVPLMYKILDEAPTLDDSHYLETAWLLNYMRWGLRTPADMSIFRKRRVFEKLFTLYNNPYLATGLREKILRILYRATTIEGGSTTLITRFSTMTWLQAQVALGGGIGLKVLMERVMESCDTKRVGTWSKKGAEGVRAAVRKL